MTPERREEIRERIRDRILKIDSTLFGPGVDRFEQFALDVWDEAVEEAADVAKNGRFLHHESLEAQWGSACAKMIISLKAKGEK